jgi:FkbM family methyltransferase
VFNQLGDVERCVLRSGNVHSADGGRAVLEPVIARYRGIVKRLCFRGDAAFAIPKSTNSLETKGIGYTIRLPANSILQSKIGYLLKRPAGRPPRGVRRFYASFSYQAQSWKKPRRVVAKVVWRPDELHPSVGFLVTNLARPAERPSKAGSWLETAADLTNIVSTCCFGGHIVGRTIHVFRGSKTTVLGFVCQNRFSKSQERTEGFRMKEVARDLCPPILWNLAARLRKLTRKVELEEKIIHGVKMTLPPGHYLDHTVRYHPHYNTALPEFLNFLRLRLGQSAKLLIVDVGANVGDSALLIAAKLGSDNVQFICLEGDDQYLPYLRKNTEQLNVEIIHTIVGPISKVEQLAFQSSENRGTSSIVPGSGAKAVVALDDVLAGRHPDLIKIDTDGYDLHVLRGSARCLRDTGPHLFVEYSPYHLQKYGKEKPTSLLSFARDMGYCTTVVYDNTGYPICVADLNSREFAMTIAYIHAKPSQYLFYVDLLISKDRALLKEFYETDIKRFNAFCRSG